MEKIKVSAVSYLNTKPFLYGLEHSAIHHQFELTQDIPSVIAEKLISGKCTVGLVPTAVIPDIPGSQIIGDYCIGCDGEVGSVCIYSQVPLEEASAIYLDYQSRTSVELSKILMKDFWKVSPEVLPTDYGYEDHIAGNVAGLIIGDRSLQLKNNFNYSYDLGTAWKEMTGLPFVFAAWVSNRKLPASFIDSFNAALKSGVENVPNVARQNEFFYPGVDTFDYLYNKIQYRLTGPFRSGMETFLEHLKMVEKV